MYSPPLASGPCSMVAYKKLADVNNGGAGTIFEIFEYTSDGTPYVKPRISSGYAILKQSGELIYRTTSNQDDVNGKTYFIIYLDTFLINRKVKDYFNWIPTIVKILNPKFLSH